jgi:NTE family protein
MPGLFTPISHEGRWLIDGGVVNPVPVSLCRALGADYVIAVNLNKTIARRHRPRDIQNRPDNSTDFDEGAMLSRKWPTLLEDFVRSVRSDRQADGPALIDVLSATVNIMQDNLTQERIARDQPNVVVIPALKDFRLMDFHRAAEAIDIGYRAVQQVATQLPGFES